MTTFESVHEARIAGKLVAFDWLIFKGHMNSWMPKGAFARFLFVQGVLLTGFKAYVARVTGELKAHAMAERRRRATLRDLAGPSTASRGRSKEERAREIAARDDIREGRSRCSRRWSPAVRSRCGATTSHRLEVVRAARKCLFFYFYIMDRELGFMHVRLQSWFPFTIQVYVNGREWLCQELERHGVGFERSDDKLLRVDDLDLAQRLAKQFAERNWVRVLDAFARRFNPHLQQIVKSGFGSYYWVVDQCEVATDVMFKNRKALEEVLPEFYEAALLHLSPDHVLRFLGRKLHPSLKAEVTTHHKRRVEGRRVKHRVGRNSIKMRPRQGASNRDPSTTRPTSGWPSTKTPTRARGQLGAAAQGRPEPPALLRGRLRIQRSLPSTPWGRSFIRSPEAG